MRYINFDNIKVGDVVYLDNWKKKVEENDKAEVVSVTEHRFRTKQNTHRGDDQIVEHNKEDGSYRGYAGRRALCVASPEGVAAYRQMLVKVNEAKIELERKSQVALNLNELLREAGLSTVSVDGGGSFNISIFANEQDAKNIVSALIASGVKL